MRDAQRENVGLQDRKIAYASQAEHGGIAGL
jgi:hypothetical protein